MKKKKYLCLLTAGILAVGTFGTPGLEARAEKGQEDAPDGMTLAASNDTLELYVDEKEATIAVRDIASGQIWYSSPQDADADEIATSYYKKFMKAQLTVQYYNESVQASDMDSYNDSVAEEQFTIDYLDDGVTITYTMGQTATSLLLPTAITEERMNAFMEKMSDKALKKVKRNYTLTVLDELDEDEKKENLALYPGLETHNLYLLRANAKDYLKEELAEYFEEAGYTAEDFELDMAELGETEAESTPWFTVPLTFRLDGDSLTASVDPSAITYNDAEYYLTNIGILPYFGAADASDEGYMFVPDGSGALINLNNGKTTASSYDALVYGQDKTLLMLSKKKSEIDENLTVKLPVFGMKDTEGAWFAVIEDGDAYANITADISGKTTSYNHVYSRFTYLECGGISLGDMVGSNSMQMYSLPQFGGTYSLRYFFRGGEDSDYSWMAERYRGYLEDSGVLTRLETADSLPFYAEYIGAIDKYETILGIRYRAVKPLTTYAQAQEITGWLKDNGVDDLTVVYSGWANDGLAGTAATKIKPVKGLEKGGTSLKEFTKDMKEQEIPLYMTVDYQNVYQDKMFDGYSTMALAPRYFDHTTVKAATYLVANSMVDERNINLISPYYVEKTANQTVGTLTSKGIAGVQVSGLSNTIFTDMLSGQYMDAEDALEANSNVMQMLSEKMEDGIMGDNANEYAFGYMKDIVNTPMSSNNYYIIDEEIPFYQMVLHGYMNYAGDAMNLSDDYRTSFLKCLESGAGMYFKWIYADNSIVKETEFDYLYSICYSAWVESAAESYRELNEVLGSLQGKIITKHEIVQKDVTCTTYEDGTKIWVNYSQDTYKDGGLTVEARGYSVERGEEP